MGNHQLEQQLGGLIQKLVDDSIKEREIPALLPSRSNAVVRVGANPFLPPGPAPIPHVGETADVEWLAKVLGKKTGAVYDMIRFGFVPEACICRTGRRCYQIRPAVVYRWLREGIPGHMVPAGEVEHG